MTVNTHLHALLKSLARIILGLIVAILLALLLVLASLATETGRLFWLKNGLMLVQSEQLSVVLNQPRWPALNRLELDYVLISQHQKPVLELSGAVLDAALLPLLKKRLHIRTLSTQNLVLYRLAKNTQPRKKREPFALQLNIPHIPPVKVERIRLKGIKLKGYNWQAPPSSPSPTSPPSPKPPKSPKEEPQPEAANTAAPPAALSSRRFALEGTLAINWPAATASRTPLLLQLTLTEHGNALPLAQLTGTSSQAYALNIRGRVQHPRGGWVSQRLRLPANQPVDAAFELSATQSPTAPQPEPRAQPEPHLISQNANQNSNPLSPSQTPSAAAPIHITLQSLNAAVLNQQLKASGQLILDTATQSLQIPNFTLAINQQTHQLSGHINPQQVALNLNLNAFDLALFKPWAAGLSRGQISSQSTLTWDWNTQHWPTGTVQLQAKANYQQQSLALNSQLHLTPNTLQVKHLKAALGKATLNIKGRVHTQQKSSALTFTAHHLRDGPLRQILPASLAQRIPKALSLHAQRIGGLVRGTLKQPKIIADVNILGRYQGTAFALHGHANANTQHANIAALTAEIDDTLLQVSGLADWTGSTTQLNGTVKRLSPALAYKHQLPLPPGIEGIVNGSWQLSGPLRAPALQVKALFQGGYAHQNQVLPFNLTVDASTQVGNLKTMTVDINTLRLATFTRPLIAIEGSLGAYSNNLKLVVARLPVQLLQALGLPVGEGRAEARLRLTGSYSAPKLAGFVSYGETITVRRGSSLTNNKAQQVPLIWHANIHSQNKELIVDSGFTLDTTSAGQLAITVPWHDYLNFALNQQGGDVPTYGTVQADINTSALQLFLDADQTVIDGKLIADITLDGTAKKPIATGELLLKNGYFKQAATGTVLNNIQLYAQAEAQRINLITAFARDGEGGTLNATGHLDWSNLTHPNAINLGMRVNEAKLIDMPNVVGAVTGDMQLKGNKRALNVTGALNVSPLEINIDTTPAASIPEITVTEIFQKKEQDTQKQKVLPEVNLDIAVTIDKQAFIRGRGLTAEIGGDVKVDGTASQPQVTGNFKTLRGDIKLLQKPLVLQEGTARFSNQSFSYNIPATYDTDEHEITLVVSGTNDTIDMALSAVPALPQEEILSRLLFGDSIQNITAFEALSLASAVNTLNNGSSFDPLNTTREKLGFDNLRIGQDDEDNGGGVNIGVGKYLNERVYLELERSSNPAQPWQGNLRVDVTDEIRLNSTAASTGKASADLEWRRDY